MILWNSRAGAFYSEHSASPRRYIGRRPRQDWLPHRNDNINLPAAQSTETEIHLFSVVFLPQFRKTRYPAVSQLSLFKPSQFDPFEIFENSICVVSRLFWLICFQITIFDVSVRHLWSAEESHVCTFWYFRLWSLDCGQFSLHLEFKVNPMSSLSVFRDRDRSLVISHVLESFPYFHRRQKITHQFPAQIR